MYYMPEPNYLKIYIFADNIAEYFRLVNKFDGDTYKVLICKGINQTNILTLENDLITQEK